MAKKKQSARAHPRWVYRFNNYKKAYKLLSEAIELFGERDLSDLEEEGVIQRFEYTWELAWNLLADLMDADGLTVEPRTPREVIRAAFRAKLIANGRDWMDALDARNKMAHTYDETDAQKVIEEIRDAYLDLLGALHDLAAKRKTAP